MSFFRDRSVRTKLFGGFGLVLLVSAVTGVVLLSQLGQVNSGAEFIGTNILPSVEIIDRIEQNVLDYRRAQLKVALDARTAAGAKAKADLSSGAAGVQAGLAQFRPLIVTAADQQGFNAVVSQWRALEATTPRLIMLATRPAAPAASALVDASFPTFNTLKRTLSSWSGSNQEEATHALARNQSTYSSARTLGIGLVALAALLGLGIAFAVSRSIKRGVDTVLSTLRLLQEKCVSFLREGLEAFADGDLTRRYEPATPAIENPARDEIGQVATATNGIRQRIVAALEAYNATAERLSATIGQVAQTAGVVGASSQEMAATSEETGKATSEVAHAIGDVAAGAERQVRMLEDAKRVAEDVARAVDESAEGARATAGAAREAREVAQEGVTAAEQADSAMRSVRDSSAAVTGAIRELATKSEQVGAIVQTITGIAEQTNLLALNAAIEAARAGEHGRGFAVVAEEVRKLAEEARHAAEEISNLIEAIQGETTKAVAVVEDGARLTDDGAQVVEKARESFLRIDTSVEDMGTRIEQIAATSQKIAEDAASLQHSIAEVAAVAEQSSASTEEVSASTEQTSASAQQIAAGAQQLSGTAEELTRLVAQFKVSP